MSRLSDYKLDDLKLVYRTLHSCLRENTDLIDSDLFQDLQDYLHARALSEGVNIQEHGRWDAWLANPGIYGTPPPRLRLVTE